MAQHLSAVVRIAASPKQHQVIFSLVGLSAFCTLAVYLAVRFADGFSGAIIGIIASVMTPALGAMVTLLIVTPLRAIKAEAHDIRAISTENGEKIDGVHDLVDDRMSLLIAEMTAMRLAHENLAASNAALAIKITALETSRATPTGAP